MNLPPRHSATLTVGKHSLSADGRRDRVHRNTSISRCRARNLTRIGLAAQELLGKIGKASRVFETQCLAHAGSSRRDVNFHERNCGEKSYNFRAQNIEQENFTRKDAISVAEIARRLHRSAKEPFGNEDRCRPRI